MRHEVVDLDSARRRLRPERVAETQPQTEYKDFYAVDLAERMVSAEARCDDEMMQLLRQEYNILEEADQLAVELEVLRIAGVIDE